MSASNKEHEKEYQPMLATLVDQPFDSKDWVSETKWDGFRLVAEVGRGSVRLFSCNGIEVTTAIPPSHRRCYKDHRPSQTATEVRNRIMPKPMTNAQRQARWRRRQREPTTRSRPK